MNSRAVRRAIAVGAAVLLALGLVVAPAAATPRHVTPHSVAAAVQHVSPAVHPTATPTAVVLNPQGRVFVPASGEPAAGLAPALGPADRLASVNPRGPPYDAATQPDVVRPPRGPAPNGDRFADDHRGAPPPA